MNLIKTFTELLPIEHPFILDRLEKDESSSEVHIYISVDASYKPDANSHLHSYKERVVEHLQLFQYRTYLHLRLPIYRNKDTNKTQQIDVPFIAPNSRFTLLYELKVLELLRLNPCLSSVAQQLGVYPQRISHLYQRYTQEDYRLFKEGAICKNCTKVGIDETSTRKGHNYISPIVDMETGQIVAIFDGKSSEVIGNLHQQHSQASAITDISMDMSPAFKSGVAEYFPAAHVSYDKWHVYRLYYRYLDRYKDKDLSSELSFFEIGLEQVYGAKSKLEATLRLQFLIDYLEDKLGDNSLSKSLKTHFNGIVQHLESGLTNGILEGINSKIQTIKRIAKGFRHVENFKKMILFVFHVITPPPTKIT